MSRKMLRQSGSWLPIVIVLIVAALLIRYASSSQWWSSLTNQGGQGFQTVDTGASVQVSETGVSILPGGIPDPNPPPGNGNGGSNNSGSGQPESPSPPDRMW